MADNPNSAETPPARKPEGIYTVYDEKGGEPKVLVPVKNLGIWVGSFLGVVGTVFGAYSWLLVSLNSAQSSLEQHKKDIDELRAEQKALKADPTALFLGQLSAYDCGKLKDHLLYVNYLRNNKQCPQ
jgi:hypothetical protein